jgi:hypothetical protein
LNAVVGFSGESRADHAIDYTGAAVGYHQHRPMAKMGKGGSGLGILLMQQVAGSERQSQNP